MATASLQQDIGDQETISSWKRDFNSNRWQLDDDGWGTAAVRAATFEAPRCGAAWTRETREMEKRASSTTATDLKQKFLRI